MPRYGLVLETTRDRALIRSPRRGLCADCHDRGSCSFETALGRDKPEEVTALNPVGASAGDWVEFDLPGRQELKLSLLIWAVPLAGLIAGAALGLRFSAALSLSADGATFLGALVGLLVSLAPVVAYDRLAASSPRLLPRIRRKVSPPASCPVPEELDPSG